MNNSNIRIRTTVDGGDNYIKLPIEHDFDNLEILSLKISQEDAYKRFCSDYGVVVGRVIANGGVGVPNAKVSVFIPLSEDDENDDVISSIYPYKDIFLDKNDEGKRYNLLPNYNDTTDKCFTPVGSFPSKRQVLDNDTVLEVYEKYYKYTTTTNNSGDYMLFGVPVGSHTLHMDVDLSNIGFLSQKPYDFIREGSPKEKFESSTKFKGGEDLNSLVQINTSNKGILVRPFWGDTESCEIGITRADFELTNRIEPHAFFIGSIFGDDDNNSISKRCRLKKDIGKICESVTSEGTIEMIRKKENGTIEKYSVDGGRVIDSNGVWAIQVPMNLDYMVTNEFGELVPSEQVGMGVPTRTRARFRISMDYTGGEARRRQKASYLVPNHPEFGQVGDYTFDENTPDKHFYDMHWNNIYTVRNFIGRFQAVANSNIRDHIGIKNVDDCGDKTSFPYNHYDGDIAPLFGFLCVIFSIFNAILFSINSFVINPLNSILDGLKGISILGVKPFGWLPNIACVGAKCDDTRFAPGCNVNSGGFNKFKNNKPDEPYSNNTGDGFLDCQQLRLADNTNAIEYDFYNDWINGTLYFPLFKFKVRRNGETRFCDYDRPDNRKNHFVDNCTNDDNTTRVVKGDTINIGASGPIKYDKDNEVFYYAATSKTGNKLPLFMTDISNLGSINNNIKINGVRTMSLINQLGDTTYQKPGLNDEFFDGTTFLEEKGIDAFLLDIKCIGLRTTKLFCANTKRICELGILNGEAIGEPADGVDFEPADSVINDVDIDAISPRVKFIYNNTPSVVTPFDSAYITTTTNIDRFGSTEYRDFRNYKKLNNEITIPYDNSLFFYFGLVPGKSALQKFITKYNLPCESTEISDFVINIKNQVNNTVIGGASGSIEIEVIGGSGDYTYQWFDENGIDLTNTTPTITGLVAGVYTVVVVDIISLNELRREITITEPLSLASSNITTISPVPFDSTSGTGGLSSGEIIVNPIGGTPLYTVTLSNAGGLVAGPILGVDYLGTTFTGLTGGNYTVTIVDSNGDSESFSVDIPTPTAPVISVNTTAPPSTYNTSCGEDNGSISIGVTGGTSPNTAVNIINTVTGVNYASGINLYYNDIPAGTYDVTVIDAFGLVSNTETKTIATSNNLIIDSLTSSYDAITMQTTITTNINATSDGTGSLNYRLYEQGNDTPLITNNIGTFIGSFSGDYKVEVEDGVGCIKEKPITI